MGVKMSKAQHDLYRTWRNMIARCTNPKSPNYKYYGGRGIGVCERWKDFDSFVEDMDPRPSPEHSIDRIDNNVGYSPENCRWSTHKELCQKRASQVMLTYNGETLPLHAWAKRTGINKMTLHSRIASGWPIEKALRRPARRRQSYVNGCHAVRLKGKVNDKEYDQLVHANRSFTSCWTYLGECIEKCLTNKMNPEFSIEDLRTNETMIVVKINLPK